MTRKQSTKSGVRAHKTHHFGFVPMAPVIEPGEMGRARIDHFTITGNEFLGFRRGDSITPGTYARLFVGGGVMMSDTQMEQSTNLEALMEARGDVLIAGLGIGMLLLPILRKPEVTSVTVVEIEPDVIGLVLPRLMRAEPRHIDKLGVLQADARSWVPAQKGRKFDAIWLDVWGDCSTDELEDMRALRRRYRRWLKPDGWLGSWWWDELRERKRQGY